jgi:hypothetical protein
MLMLALLSIISIAASNTANIEVLIAGNEYGYKQNFYHAEGAAMEAVDILESIPDLYDSPPAWLEKTRKALTNTSLKNYWLNITTRSSSSTVPEASSLDPGSTHFVAGAEGIAGGGHSLGLGSSTVHEYAIYGRCEKNGVVSIKIGYRKGF